MTTYDNVTNHLFPPALLFITHNSQTQNTSNIIKNQAPIAHATRDSRPLPKIRFQKSPKMM
jgi:hypothetical protein